jgi:membrane protease YdiL (CAAX protease family)
LSKLKIYLLGLVTIIIFPLPTILFQHFYEGVSFTNILRLDEIWQPQTILGVNLGITYAFLALLFMSAPVFDALPNRIENLVRSMNLTVIDALFLSLCAGIGEELLFRTGIQAFLGVPITSIVFVAIHGYLNPWNWRMSLYGLIVLPFIFIIGYGFNTFGQWFSIGAHFSYDFILFMAIIDQGKSFKRNR